MALRQAMTFFFYNSGASRAGPTQTSVDHKWFITLFFFVCALFHAAT